MKLRQKLAMVLATAMVVTAVPVVTFAASENKVTKVLTVSKDTVFTETTTASILKLESKDAQVGEIFFLELGNAEWKDEKGTVLAGTTGAKVTITGKKEATVEIVNPANIQIPMLVKATGGEATVEVVAEDSAMTGGKYVFAKTAEADEKVAVKIGEMKTLYTEGTIANVTVEELVTGAIHSAKDANERTISLTLNNSDFEFDYANGEELIIKYGKGLASETAKAKVIITDKDYQVLNIELPDVQSTKARGTMTFEGLKVKATTKSPELGDLTVDIDGKLVKNENAVKVANVAEYGVKLSIKDDKVLDIVAGKAKDAVITLKEGIADSISNTRTAEFRLENGYFQGEVKEVNDEDVFQGTIKVNGKAVVAKDVIIEKVDGVKRAVGFEIALTATEKALDEYKIEAGIQTVIGAQGDVTIAVEGRAIDGKASLAIAKVAPDFKVETKGAKLEVGMKDQKAGQIVVTEANKGSLAKGEVITITLADDKGITFTGKPEVETTGDMKVETTFVKATSKEAAKVQIKVTRTSKEAATITVKDIPVTIDRTVPEGGYDVKLEVSNRTGKVTGENFFTIGEGVATKVTTTITNGATEMIINGAKVKLDAPAYIKNGKLMTPLRAVSEAFGIKGSDIVYNAGEIVIFANGRTIQLTIGSNVAYVNGAKMTLANPAEIKSERTFVPVGDLGRLLGVEVNWDNATKTATFKN